MRNIEKTLNYHELLMTYKDTSKYKQHDLPNGYHYEFYHAGNEKEWVEIQLSSGSMCNYKIGLGYFHDFFDHFKAELHKRCFFIVDHTGNKVATATVSLLEKQEDGFEATVDWVAIKNEHQGRGLSRPLITKIIEVAKDLGHEKLMLHTQTHTWLAAKLYLDFGFQPYNLTDQPEGWQIIKKLTEHPSLENVAPIKDDRMYSDLAIKINSKLMTMFEKDYDYTVWYKNGRNDVYVFSDGKEYEYKYHEKPGAIALERV